MPEIKYPKRPKSKYLLATVSTKIVLSELIFDFDKVNNDYAFRY